MKSLVDQFCPQVHEAPISAATYDSRTGTRATADENGLVAVYRGNDSTPRYQFQATAKVNGSLALIDGGERLVVGDDAGSIAVYDLNTEQAVFYEERTGANGRKRAFLGAAINNQGTMLAAISVDNILRVWDLRTQQRIHQWKGFAGHSVHFGARGERLLVVTLSGQPNLINLQRQENSYLQELQSPCEHALFTVDGSSIISVGSGGIYLLNISSGQLSAGLVTQGSSGIVNVLTSPDSSQIATITNRSVHIFDLPSLERTNSYRHGVKRPNSSGFWDQNDIWIGDESGRLISQYSSESVSPIQIASGYGKRRIAIHNSSIAVWKDGKRKLFFETKKPIDKALLNRDGTLIVVKHLNAPVSVYKSRTGKEFMKTQPDTATCKDIHIGGNTVAIERRNKGCHWWNLATGNAFELEWTKGICLSNGGELLAVITPQGKTRVIDSTTGKNSFPPPKPLSQSPIKLMRFVNKSPILLVVDEENVLSYYDLTESVQKGKASVGKDLIQLGTNIIEMWGVTLSEGRFAILKIHDENETMVLWVPIDGNEDPYPIRNLHSEVWVDPMTGNLIEPSRNASILERDRYGNEKTVYRSLPDKQWLSFNHNGIIERSVELEQQL